MIAHLRGILSYKSPEHIVIDVHGVGYGLFITLNTFYKLPELGEETTLLTYTHVREDTLQLYGFLSEDEKRLFQQLIGVSKIGPKLARNILSKLSVDDLKSAIIQADSGLINAIPGVGEKTAKRLILELKDKIPYTDIPEPVLSHETTTGDKESLFSDAVSALINLGYPKNKAERTVRACLSSGESFHSLSRIIKYSLDLITK
ncbi:MAG: Holliday junction branch migration protein RuvA [bacterium]